MADTRIISNYYISLLFHPFYFIKAHYAFILDTILINIFSIQSPTLLKLFMVKQL